MAYDIVHAEGGVGLRIRLSCLGMDWSNLKSLIRSRQAECRVKIKLCCSSWVTISTAPFDGDSMGTGRREFLSGIDPPLEEPRHYL